MANEDLGKAKRDKRDEFYTSWIDIEKEMHSYLDYDPDTFRGKTVLLPCDDPEWSNFTKFFALNFQSLGLKKLISTSYAPHSNGEGEYYTPTLFEIDAPQYEPEASMHKGRKFVLSDEDVNGDGVVNIDDLKWEYLKGDGDFRSREVTALRDEADIVITNPPFSLFRTFLDWVVEGDVQFSIIGNVNAVTVKEVFPLFMDNKTWFGSTISSGDREFRVPESYPLTAAGTRIDDDGNKFVRVKGVRWFTNIQHGRRHEPMRLMTMEQNLRFSTQKKIVERGYPPFENYDAIEVSFSECIPSDYEGVMGVPVTFIDKFCPEQFEILGITKTWDDPRGLKTKVFPQQTQVSKLKPRDHGVRRTSLVRKLNDGAAIKVDAVPDETYYVIGEDMYIQTYPRILIRHLRDTKASADKTPASNSDKES